jgi:hypothetical protein
VVQLLWLQTITTPMQAGIVLCKTTNFLGENLNSLGQLFLMNMGFTL